MTFTIVFLMLFLIYPVLIAGLQLYIKSKIPFIGHRRHLKKKHEYVIRLVYIIVPLLLFHLELFLFRNGYSSANVSLWPIVVLITLQVIVLLYGLYSMWRFLNVVRKESK